ncbi:hypothetical protein [Kineococcus auxinigenes]|uniref:hypothetical protein n=1 Tax=unclassified Kineococcus TaxID=2621656 RepID=UPI003D7DFD08
MRSEGVDPRDVSSEVEQPAYRVHFRERTGTAHDFPQRRGPDLGPPRAYPSSSSDEHRLLQARDVQEVLQWAQQQADGRLFVVHVETTDGGQRGLLRLQGRDPDDATSGAAHGRAATARGSRA